MNDKERPKNNDETKLDNPELMDSEKEIKNGDAESCDREKEDEVELTVEEQLEVAQQESRENYDRLMRASAEFENFKKRSQRETSDFRKFANETLIKELLSVVDNLERAIDLPDCEKNGDQKSTKGLIDGVNMTLQELLKILYNFNVTQVKALDKTFDPCVHQAVSQEITDEFPENTVIREFQKGYMIHDRLLRPSMVVVSKNQSGSGSETDLPSCDGDLEEKD